MKFAILDSFSDWLGTTQLSHFVTNQFWVWPACETLHFIGLSLLIGVIGAMDLRMLGVAKRVPFGPLNRLLPWGIAGFVINLITGLLFYIGAPFQYVHNIAFQFKILFILLAGINVLIFYLTVAPQVEAMGPGDDAPTAAKVMAGASLFLWIGVLYWGRMLPFIGQAF
jgi:uncharacterized membrane protein